MVYGYDAAGRFSSVGNAFVSVGAGYDTLSRVTSISRGVSLVHAFTPTSGNEHYGFTFTPASQTAAAATTNTAWDWQGAAGTTVNTTADGLNRDAAIAAVGSPCAAQGAGGACPRAGQRPDPGDCNGNLTFDGTRTFSGACPRAGRRPETGNAENRLLSESGPATMTLAYDPLGRLQQSVVGGTTTQFLHDGPALVAEYDGGGNILRRYVHGPGIDNPVIWFEGYADPLVDHHRRLLAAPP